MAVAFDAVGPSSSGQRGASSPITWSHTCTGSNLVLIVFAAVDSGSDGSITCSATYNSVSMTSVQRWESGGAGQSAGFIQAFKMINPPAGTNTVSVSATGTLDAISGGSLSFTGADQSTGIGAVSTGDSNGLNVTSGSVTVSSTTSGNIVAAGLCDGSSGVSFTSGTSRFNSAGAGSGAAGDSAGATAASTGSAVSITWTQNNDFYGAIAFEILAGSVVTSGPALTGRDMGQRPVIAVSNAGWRGAQHSR